MQVAAFNRAVAGRSEAARFLLAAWQRRTGDEHPLTVADMLTYSAVRPQSCTRVPCARRHMPAAGVCARWGLSQLQTAPVCASFCALFDSYTPY